MASDDSARPPDGPPACLAAPLLGPGDPPPVTVVNPGGASAFVLIGDHAGNRVPSALGTLGVGAADRARHIGWDIGVAGLGERLAAALDAPFLHQTYSRLVIDCNRDPAAPDAMPPVSDGTPIPGNAALADADRQARVAAIHAPYQRAIAAALDRRRATGRATILIALHSFTPRLANGGARPWQVGVLHDRGDARFAHRLLATLRAGGDLVVGDNEPYRMDLVDYTIPRHAYPADLPYAELEVRQDLIADAAGQDEWCDRLAAALTATAAGAR